MTPLPEWPPRLYAAATLPQHSDVRRLTAARVAGALGVRFTWNTVTIECAPRGLDVSLAARAGIRKSEARQALADLSSARLIVITHRHVVLPPVSPNDALTGLPQAALPSPDVFRAVRLACAAAVVTQSIGDARVIPLLFRTVGTDATIDAIAAVADMPAADVRVTLARLVVAGHLAATGTDHDTRWALPAIRSRAIEVHAA